MGVFMVLWLFFTILDFAVSIIVLGEQLGWFGSWRLLFSSGIYLLGKGFVFRGDLLSILDMVCGAYILFMILGLRTFIAYIIVGYLIYKVLMYFIMGGSGS